MTMFFDHDCFHETQNRPKTDSPCQRNLNNECHCFKNINREPTVTFLISPVLELWAFIARTSDILSNILDFSL